MSTSRLRYGDMLRVFRSHYGSPSVPGLVDEGFASVFPTNCVESYFYDGSELWDGRYISSWVQGLLGIWQRTQSCAVEEGYETSLLPPLRSRHERQARSRA